MPRHTHNLTARLRQRRNVREFERALRNASPSMQQELFAARCPAHPYDATVARVALAGDEAGRLHLAHESTDGWRLDLFGGGKLADGARSTHQHRQRRQLSRVDARQWVGSAQPAQQVNRGRVKAVGKRARLERGRGHTAAA